MQLTDDEIRAILIEERKRKKKKQRTVRRIKLILIVLFLIVLAVGIFMNRNARVSAKGIIFIDPGHGGMDGGSVVGKRLEKDDTLSLSLLVKDRLEELGYKVYMSRTDDEDVDREQRGMIANEKNAQLMVSIHRNKADEGEGAEVYIPSSDSKACRLLGNNIMKALVDQGFTERRVRPGTLVTENDDYYENSVPTMPSCLVEIGFMQNKHDNKLFDEKKESIATALADAIDSTFDSLYPPEDKDE